MKRTPVEALRHLLEAAEDGSLESLCHELGIDLLVAFGSAVRPIAGDVPGDLDIGVRFRGEGDIIAATSRFVAFTACDGIDLLDIGRAGIVARAAVFSRPEPLYETVQGEFTRASMAALVARADTEWIRQLQLDRLAS